MDYLTTSIKVMMLTRNETQEDLAQQVGMTRQQLNSKLNGRRQFTIDEVRRIMKHYQVTPDQFYAIFME